MLYAINSSNPRCLFRVSRVTPGIPWVIRHAMALSYFSSFSLPDAVTASIKVSFTLRGDVTLLS